MSCLKKNSFLLLLHSCSYLSTVTCPLQVELSVLCCLAVTQQPPYRLGDTDTESLLALD
jgi:hypothetical protein